MNLSTSEAEKEHVQCLLDSREQNEGSEWEFRPGHQGPIALERRVWNVTLVQKKTIPYRPLICQVTVMRFIFFKNSFPGILVIYCWVTNYSQQPFYYSSLSNQENGQVSAAQFFCCTSLSLSENQLVAGLVSCDWHFGLNIEMLGLSFFSTWSQGLWTSPLQ